MLLLLLSLFQLNTKTNNQQNCFIGSVQTTKPTTLLSNKTIHHQKQIYKRMNEQHVDLIILLLLLCCLKKMLLCCFYINGCCCFTFNGNSICFCNVAAVVFIVCKWIFHFHLLPPRLLLSLCWLLLLVLPLLRMLLPVICSVGCLVDC